MLHEDENCYGRIELLPTAHQFLDCFNNNVVVGLHDPHNEYVSCEPYSTTYRSTVIMKTVWLFRK